MLSAGLKSSSHSILKCDGLQSRPGVSYSLGSEGSRHLWVGFALQGDGIN